MSGVLLKSSKHANFFSKPISCLLNANVVKLPRCCLISVCMFSHAGSSI
jgi:hypothetical protein